MFIYGSVALKRWYPETRTPSDVDIISRDHDWISAFEYLEDHNKNKQYVDPDLLLTIKVSHAHWDIHWDKTMKDIVFLLNKGHNINNDFYNLLYPCWEELHGKKKVKLTGSNNNFFRTNITRKYDHEYLHEVLAFGERPLHEKIRKDLDSPMCSEELFQNLPFEEKIKCAMEEIIVFGTERWIIPHKTPMKHSQYKALKQLITSSTSGWFAKFLILNFEQLIYYDCKEHWTNKLKLLGENSENKNS